MAPNRRRRKQEVVTSICLLAGIPEWKVSSGSTEPRGLLLDLVRRFDLALDCQASKPELARAIVESADLVWLSRFESRGSTITLHGLLMVEEAVIRFLSE